MQLHFKQLNHCYEYININLPSISKELVIINHKVIQRYGKLQYCTTFNIYQIKHTSISLI